MPNLTPPQKAIALDAFLHGMGPQDIANRLALSYDDVYAYLNGQKLEALRRLHDPIPGIIGSGGGESGFGVTVIAGVDEDGNIVLVSSNSDGAIFVDTTGITPTYRASAAAFVPVADAVLPFFTLKGSDTKTVTLRRIKVSWACTTGNSAPCLIQFVRYTAVSGGTFVMVPSIPSDTLNPAPTATLRQYSVLPSATPYNAGASCSEFMQWVTNAAGIVASVPVEWVFGVDGGQAAVLRGTSEFFGIRITAVAAGAPTMTIRVEWTEN
jgi:hypothetical protein